MYPQNPSLQMSDNSVLTQAATDGDVDLVRELLHSEANINHTNSVCVLYPANLGNINYLVIFKTILIGII